MTEAVGVREELNSFRISQIQFEKAVPHLDVPAGILEYVRRPERTLKVEFPVAMDDGSTRVFTGFRVQHNNARGPFKDFSDFIRRVDARAINRRVLECLVKTGAFDFTGELRGTIFHRLDEAVSDAAARQRDLSLGQESFLDALHIATARAAYAKFVGA